MTNGNNDDNITVLYNAAIYAFRDIKMNVNQQQSTLGRIHQAAMKEFLDKGFVMASLRNIVKTAGVTTGAFYGYYKSKEELFDALVKEPAVEILNAVDNHTDSFNLLSAEEQTCQMREFSHRGMVYLLNYLYEHKKAFKLLTLSADGTKYEDFVHQLADKETVSSFEYVETLRDAGIPVKKVNKQLIHIISSGLITAVLETIVHDMPKEEAAEYLKQLEGFMIAGWEQMLGVKFGGKEV